MALEYIWFTFHPLSQYSTIFPIDALSLINKSLCKGWNALELSAQLEADHETDDADENSKYNRKTDLYSKIYRLKRRFQELNMVDWVSLTPTVITSKQSRARIRLVIEKKSRRFCVHERPRPKRLWR